MVRYILEGELMGFADEMKVGWKKGVKDDSRLLV